MNLKIRDEAQHHREMNRRRDKLRRWLKNRHEHKHYKYKMLIKELRTEAERTRKEMAEKYRKKLKHLEEKYQEKETEERIPTDMEQLKELRIFRQEKFEEIETEEIEVPIIGEVELTENEKKVLKRTPKFAIPERLLEHTLKEDMEKAYSKIRMELRDEEVEEEELNKEITAPPIQRTEEEKEKEKLAKETDARSRQIYDPEERKYDDRNRRATDLVECSRITLPRPLNIIREAQIENRREIHNRIFQEYRKEFCPSNGEQESGLTDEEKKGLRTLQKRIKKGEIVALKTDKSGKFSIATREKYLEMGEVHVGKDTIIDRKKVRELDKIMNENSRAWCSIWGTGANHEQEDRVLNSKISRSENTAKLYLAHKDHKKEADKTRPIGTANTSNTRGFASSVSDLELEFRIKKNTGYRIIYFG